MTSKHGISCNSVDRPHSVIGRAVCLSLHPGRMILFPFRTWFHRRYNNKYKFARSIFAFDSILTGIVITLLGFAITLFFFPHKNFEDNIFFSATVAPRAIITGDQSTLVLQYRNGTKEPLREAKLNLKFPNHFLLQSITVNEKMVSEQTLDLGEIPIGGTGTIHIKGVM
ncbi:MAG: hypothetical protein AAB664_04435, partial [Patescibacteria group bacterium]